MKMNPTGDFGINGRIENISPQFISKQQQRDVDKNSEFLANPSPKDIGREFVRQYYTMLSERPNDVFRFYSHESFFMHGGNDEFIQGQQNIQKAIENLQFVDCKARIHTVQGTTTINNGLVIQVCGELSIHKAPGRRFLQTFILCPQTPKKYYVHNDVFQWVDQAFAEEGGHDSLSDNESSPAPTPVYVEIDSTIEQINGHEELPRQNGNHQDESTLPIYQQTSELSLGPIYEDTHETLLVGTDEQQHIVDETHNWDDSSPMVGPTESSNEQSPAQEQLEARQQEEEEAVTWARRLFNTPPAPPAPPLPMVLPETDDAHLSALPPPSDDDTNLNTTRRLYVGGIRRDPERHDFRSAEDEVQRAFEKFGEVESVRIPAKGMQGMSVYVFIVMRTVDGASEAFRSCGNKRDKSGRLLMHLSIDSFNFAGNVTLEGQRDDIRTSNRPGLGSRQFHPNVGGGLRGMGGSRGFAPSNVPRHRPPGHTSSFGRPDWPL